MKNAFISSLILILGSCTFKEYKSSPNEDIRIQSLRPSYINLSINIFEPKCGGCHTGSGGAGKSDIMTYDSILRFIVKGQPEASRLYNSLSGVGGTMPKDLPPLDPREIQVIADWIKAGAPLDLNNGENKPDQPAPVEPTYASIKAKIFDTACKNCHQGPTPAGDVDLTTYAGLFDNILYPDLIVKGSAVDSLIYKDVRSGRMPWKRTPLSEEEIKAIFDWINAGAKETEEVTAE